MLPDARNLGTDSQFCLLRLLLFLLLLTLAILLATLVLLLLLSCIITVRLLFLLLLAVGFVITALPLLGLLLSATAGFRELLRHFPHHIDVLARSYTTIIECQALLDLVAHLFAVLGVGLI